MKPDASKFNPDPEYIRGLVEASGLSQHALAERLGVSPRILRYYVSGERTITYPVQYALEQMAK